MPSQSQIDQAFRSLVRNHGEARSTIRTNLSVLLLRFWSQLTNKNDQDAVASYAIEKDRLAKREAALNAEIEELRAITVAEVAGGLPETVVGAKAVEPAYGVTV